jgi:hypothetical protein
MMIGAVFFCHSATAQDSSQSLMRKATSACGPAETRFAVSAAPSSFVVPVSHDQAKVFFIGHALKGSFSGPVIRLGIDGRWVGAVKGNSYIVIPVTPGTHHFCAQVQGRGADGYFGSDVALNVFTLHSGETCYLAIDSPDVVPLGILTLDALNTDEAKLLIALSRQVLPHEEQLKNGSKP